MCVPPWPTEPHDRDRYPLRAWLIDEPEVQPARTRRYRAGLTAAVGVAVLVAALLLAL